MFTVSVFWELTLVVYTYCGGQTDITIWCIIVLVTEYVYYLLRHARRRVIWTDAPPYSGRVDNIALNKHFSEARMPLLTSASQRATGRHTFTQLVRRVIGCSSIRLTVTVSERHNVQPTSNVVRQLSTVTTSRIYVWSAA